MYLAATVVTHQGQHFVQKSGVCIGSRVAPYLCDLFLAASGRNTQENLNDARVKAIFRYVDDYLVLCNTEVEDPGNGCNESVLTSFQKSCPESVFTYELPLEKSIKFLDLLLEFKASHICWRYESRSCKEFLPYTSLATRRPSKEV